MSPRSLPHWLRHVGRAVSETKRDRTIERICRKLLRQVETYLDDRSLSTELALKTRAVHTIRTPRSCLVQVDRHLSGSTAPMSEGDLVSALSSGISCRNVSRWGVSLPSMTHSWNCPMTRKSASFGSFYSTLLTNLAAEWESLARLGGATESPTRRSFV